MKKAVQKTAKKSAKQPAKKAVKKAKTAQTIMIVDDEPDIRATVQELLQKNGFNTVTAVDGDDCLRKIGKQKLDLILLDVMMPGTPVKQITKQITSTKIAYLTVVRPSEAEKEQLLKERNIVGFIQKPFNIQDLLAAVKKMLS